MLCFGCIFMTRNSGGGGDINGSLDTTLHYSDDEYYEPINRTPFNNTTYYNIKEIPGFSRPTASTDTTHDTHTYNNS